MRFYNQILARTLEISQFHASQVKVLVSEAIRFPSIGKDANGFITKVPKPCKTKNGLLLNNMIFPNNSLGRALMMCTSNATTIHLSLHMRIGDFTIYDEWRNQKDEKLAALTADLIEDYCIKQYMIHNLEGLLRDIALAEATSLATIPTMQSPRSVKTILQYELQSYLTAKSFRYILPMKLKKDIISVSAELETLKDVISKDRSSEDSVAKIRKKKIEVADFIYSCLSKYGSPRSLVYLPYTNVNERFVKMGDPSAVNLLETTRMLPLVEEVLGMDSSRAKDSPNIMEDAHMQETSNTLYDLAQENSWKEKLAEQYASLVKDTNFEEFTYPAEDYAEYYRTYRKHLAAIRRMTDYIQMLKNNLDTDPNREVGQVDIQEVIQAMSAQKINDNVFVRDEFLTKEEAWCIILDMSSSLPSFPSVKAMALCLAEVAKSLMRGTGTWGLYGFSDRLTIIKDIGEEYNSNVKARIGGLKRGGLSYIPDALKLGARILSASNKEHNYIFLISDGMPSGYDGIDLELKNAIKSVMALGITFIPVSVGTNRFRKYMRNARLVAETPSDLMNRFAGVYFDYSVV